MSCRAWGLLGLVLFFCCTSSLVCAKGLEQTEERGKKIYFTGSSQPGRAATAYFGEDYVEVSAEMLTCASCHGYDGLGRPESGLEPFNITWKYLTKSYGHRHSGGLKHPPFTEQSLKDFLLSGVYPGGAKGDTSMPIYDFSDAELTDLVAFLKRLGTLPAQGVHDDSISLGTVLPTQGPEGEIGDSVRQVLNAFFTDVNRSGGIYGRKIELTVLPAAAFDQNASAALNEAASDLFAFLSTLTPGLDLEYQAFWAEQQVPLVAPLTFFPLNEFNRNRYSFFLYSGLRDQLQALFSSGDDAVFSREKPLAAIYLDNPESRWAVEALEKDLLREKWQFKKIPLAWNGASLDATVDALQNDKIGQVLLLLPDNQARSFLHSASQKDYHPQVVVPGGLFDNLPADVGSVFANRLFFIYPYLGRDLDPAGLNEFMGLLNRYNVKPTHLQAQTTAYVAAKLSVDGLRKSGRKVDRPKFVSALESLYKFRTGLTRPVSYGRNQRVGISGTYLVTYKGPGYTLSDLAKSAKWIEPARR